MKTAARRKRSPMSRLRPYWIVCAVVAAFGIWAVVYGVNEPAFHLKKLSVVGISKVSRADVVARAAIDPRANVWFLNKRAIEARIVAIPFVLAAHVHRTPLADVSIDVSERTPVACVRDSGRREITIDRDNRVLQTDCTDPALLAYGLRSPLDVRAGAFVHVSELDELESAGGRLANEPRRFSAFSHDRFGQLVAVMPSGIAVEFGDVGDLDRKERLIAPILAELGPKAGSVRAVDLRAVATPVVEFRAAVVHRHPQPADTQ